MPVVVACSDKDESWKNSHIHMLKDAGFEIRHVHDKAFIMGDRSDTEEIEILRGASAVLARGERYSPQVLRSLPDLRVIARLGVGFDRVDIEAATKLGIAVAITPSANHEAVAEHALALILALAKSLIIGDRGMRADGWPATVRAPIRGKTLGIVGLGRIGRSLAVRAKAMGMVLIATELAPKQSFIDEFDIKVVDLEMLLETADYVSLHCPLSDKTRGMIDKDKLAQMKQDAALINTARGGLVVEDDLIAALSTGTIGGAGLDVFEQEPTYPHNPLYELDNVVLSPHIAGTDSLGVENMGIEAAKNIIELSKNNWPDDSVVNSELKNNWSW